MNETPRPSHLRRALDCIEELQRELKSLRRRVARLEAQGTSSGGKALTQASGRQSKLLSLSQASALIGFSTHEIRRACLDGKLEYFRAGDAPTSPIKVEQAALDAWFESRRNVRVLSQAESSECDRMARG